VLAPGTVARLDLLVITKPISKGVGYAPTPLKGFIMSLQLSALKCIERYSNTQPGSPPYALEALEGVVVQLEDLRADTGLRYTTQEQAIQDALSKANLVLSKDRGQDVV